MGTFELVHPGETTGEKMNLLDETTEVLKNNGKTWCDVKWVGCCEFKISPEDVKKYFDVEYDAGHGTVNVAKDLMVVGEDFYMTRYEYDGAERWYFHTMPEEPTETRRINGVANKGYWANLRKYVIESQKDPDNSKGVNENEIR